MGMGIAGFRRIHPELQTTKFHRCASHIVPATRRLRAFCYARQQPIINLSELLLDLAQGEAGLRGSGNAPDPSDNAAIIRGFYSKTERR